MTTVVRGPRPPEIEQWLQRRRALGQDLFDEVWEGDYHVAPAPTHRHGDVDHQLGQLLGPRARAAGLRGSGPCNIGTPDDYRVPDQAYVRGRTGGTWLPTAAIVVEVISPGDESRAKLPFYHRAGVDEVILADPVVRTVEWFVSGPDGPRAAERSQLLGVSADELRAAIDWPD